MLGVDKNLANAEKRKATRQKEDLQRQEVEKHQAEKRDATVELASSSSSTSTSPDEDSKGGMSTPKQRRTGPRPSTSYMSPELVAALDRTKTSNRGAVHLVEATVSSLGHDKATLALNRESIRRARRSHRALLAEEIKKNFSLDTPLIVHWDGKIVPHVTGGVVDRLAILVSGDGVDKLLGVPMLPSGTGKAQADAVMEALQDWGLEDRVIGLGFDTTASNTGIIGGTCILLEQALGRQLLNLACRHHMHELVAMKAFTECMGPSTGPEIVLFSRFKNQWMFLATTSEDVRPLLDEEIVAPLLEKRKEFLELFGRHITKSQPRDDYKELLELSIITLGGLPPRGVHLRRPGALHRARWMATLIYGMKIWVLRDQFQLTSSERKGLKRFINFVLFLYVPAWYSAVEATAAPARDLRFYQSLVKYEDVDKGLSKAVVGTFGRHLWYLSEHLVGLALFDFETPETVLEELAKAMKEVGAEGGKQPPKRIKLNPSGATSKRLSDFATPASSLLLDRLGCGRKFLELPVEDWKNDTQYLLGQRRAKALGVINDRAERGVALMKDFNLQLTRDESQHQFILQVVEQHRKENPSK